LRSFIFRHCERSEAIHAAQERKNGLLRRFAPRNDDEYSRILRRRTSGNDLNEPEAIGR
jgi:hypothetical protein